MSDQNVTAVIVRLRQREQQGLKVYDVTTDKAGLPFLDWLEHLQDELLDAAVYIQELKRQGGER